MFQACGFEVGSELCKHEFPFDSADFARGKNLFSIPRKMRIKLSQVYSSFNISMVVSQLMLRVTAKH